MSIYEVTADNGLVEVAAIGEYDYSWSELKVFHQASSNRFFWKDDSGCSCYGYGDDINTLGDLCDGDKDAATRAVDAYYESIKGTYCASTDEDYAKAKAAIRDFKAAR